MHSLTLFISTLTFGRGLLAGPVSRATHLGDFRLYGATNCLDENLGVWTVIDEDVKSGQCTSFSDKVLSVSLTDIKEGWNLYVYSELDCTGGKHLVKKEECLPSETEWKGWTFEKQ